MELKLNFVEQQFYDNLVKAIDEKILMESDRFWFPASEAKPTMKGILNHDEDRSRNNEEGGTGDTD